MIEIPGAPALSAFRIAKLLVRLQKLEPRVENLESRFVHFVDLERPLQPAERDVLERLLTYGPRAEPEGPGRRDVETLLVVRPTLHRCVVLLQCVGSSAASATP